MNLYLFKTLLYTIKCNHSDIYITSHKHHSSSSIDFSLRHTIKCNHSDIFITSRKHHSSSSIGFSLRHSQNNNNIFLNKSAGFISNFTKTFLQFHLMVFSTIFFFFET